ncbi:MAG: DegT/DnrJ/EryC1/StrS family aminotransferase [Pseudomonadales bacterium]
MSGSKPQRFDKSFTQQEAIPDEGIAAAIEVMQSGRLHRYNTIDDQPSETDWLEIEFSEYLGVSYALACASGGYAIQVALRSAGVKSGDHVFCNAYTLAPVPGAIHNLGAIPVFIETTDQYTIDCDHLEQEARRGRAQYLLLSHMRGHLVDMDRLMAICVAHNITLIEDCAHTMGASWDGKKSGTWGKVSCFSCQTYKHINSGEGGFLVSNDEQLMARAVIYSGSYMLYGKHKAAPSAAAFDTVKYTTPNFSGRMDNLRAAILRPQLRQLEQQCARWNELYDALERELRDESEIYLPRRPLKESFVGSSLQFSLPRFEAKEIEVLVANCSARGVELKWFGRDEPQGYTSRMDSWRYLEDLPDLPNTQRVLAHMLDIRLPLTFDESDCKVLAAIIKDAYQSMG